MSSPIEKLKASINARLKGAQRPLSLANQLHLELSQESGRCMTALSGLSGIGEINALYSKAIAASEKARDAVVAVEDELRAMYGRVGSI